MSTVLELAGFACIIAGVYLAAGLAAGILTAGLFFVVIALALDGLPRKQD